jgi:hypothetical protein
VYVGGKKDGDHDGWLPPGTRGNSWELTRTCGGAGVGTHSHESRLLGHKMQKAVSRG